MSHLAPERVPLGAYVDREQKQAVRELAQRSDRSVSSIVRRAIRNELARSGGSSSGSTTARSPAERAGPSGRQSPAARAGDGER